MSISSEKNINKTDLVPVIKSDLFSNNEDMRFALLSVSRNNVVNYENDSIEQAYLRLRANVYIDQTGFLEENAKRYDGTELDRDDERSTHLVAVENLMGRVAIFGCIRVIEKTSNNVEGLPIEEFFDETFNKQEAPINSVEISRFIVRHENRLDVARAKMMLVSGALARTFDGGFNNIYAVIETNLERDLRMMRIPTKRVAEPKFIEEYNTSNLGVEIDKCGCMNSIGHEAVCKSMKSLKGEAVFWK